MTKRTTKQWQGIMQAHAEYAGYYLTLAQLVACLARMRRKFIEAKKMQCKNAKVGKADWALNQIQKLYRIEKQIKDKTVEERYRIRQEQSLLLLLQLKTLLDKSSLTVLPQSLLGKAINYAHVTSRSEVKHFITDRIYDCNPFPVIKC